MHDLKPHIVEIGIDPLLAALELFIAHVRTDVFGEGYAAEGRFAYKTINRPITLETLRVHLAKGPRIGAYLMRPGSDTTRLAVFDFDDKDGALGWNKVREILLRIVESARRHGLTGGWAVRSGGGNGAHLAFRWEADRAQSAADVRYTMMTILAAEGFSEGTGGLGKSQVEIFPKQSRLEASGERSTGSLIALPFGRKSVPLDESMQPCAAPRDWISAENVRPRPQREEKKPDHPGETDTAALRDALSHLPADDYTTWINFGIAVKRALGDAGFGPWDEWSSKAGNYCGSDKARRKWNTFNEKPFDGCITVATIFAKACQAGWMPPRPPTNLPVIRIAAGELPRMVDEAEEALLSADCGLYEHESGVVRLVWGKARTAEENGRTEEVSVLVIAPVEKAYLLDRLDKSAYWTRYNAAIKKWVHADCPPEVAERYLSRKGERKLPWLLGVSLAPTLRPDGSLLDRPGYDAQSGIVCNPAAAEFPAVPENPSKEDAVKALHVLMKPISKYEFISNAHRSVALAALITAPVRRSLPTAPGFGFTASIAGSGKTKLMDVCSVVMTGRRAAVVTYEGNRFDDQRFKTEVESKLLGGAAMVALDNLIAPLRGAFVAALLTAESVSVRIFHKQAIAEVLNSFLLVVTGNNLTIGDTDLIRRILIARIKSNTDRPELRSFDFDPVAYAKHHRGELVVAALTVLRAWITSEDYKHKPPPALGSYERWNDWVRGALLWLGEADPILTIEETREATPALGADAALAYAWRRVSVGGWVTAAGAIRSAMTGKDAFPGGGTADMWKDFYDAVVQAIGEDVSPKKLGDWLRWHKDTPITLEKDQPPFRFVSGAGPYKTTVWRLVQDPGAAAPATLFNQEAAYANDVD